MRGKRISDQDLAGMTSHEASSYWFVRHDSDHMTADDRKEFETWLAASEDHRRAYEETASMWRDFADSAAEDELRVLRVAALTAAPASHVWLRASAIAAAILGAVALSALAWHSSTNVRSDEIQSSSSNAHYVTAHNQRSTVTLPDGTLVSMNLDTALDTDFSAGKRLIHLAKGQAFFDVAKDRHRPFIVTAADRHIQALGTKFDVKLDANRVEVVLLEGRVSVDRSDPSLLDKIAHRSTHVELAPGQRLVTLLGKVPTIMSTNAVKATSWREGWIVFEDETVEHAIAELNRYSDRPLIAKDETVKRLRLSGVFRIGQPDRFGAVVQELLPITVEHGANGETVLALKSKDAPRP